MCVAAFCKAPTRQPNKTLQSQRGGRGGGGGDSRRWPLYVISFRVPGPSFQEDVWRMTLSPCLRMSSLDDTASLTQTMQAPLCFKLLMKLAESPKVCCCRDGSCLRRRETSADGRPLKVGYFKATQVSIFMSFPVELPWVGLPKM